MGNFLDFVKAVVTSLSLEIQENILFYVGDVQLYFNFSHKSNDRLRTLITKNDGAGFALEDAIKSPHKPLIQWLLTSFELPKDYLLLTAVVYGDLFTLMHVITCIGEDYKEYDTLAILYCISAGKISLLEYLYERNVTFNCHHSHIRRCIITGMCNSSEMCSWYLKNKKICPPIGKETLLQAYLENDDITRASEYLGSQDIKILLSAMFMIKSEKEETFQWLIVTYPKEEHVLICVAAACARLGHVDTLEVLLNEPYNVTVEYGMFYGIDSVAVAKILHQYAYKQDSISQLLNHGHIRKVKSRFSTYRNRKSYRRVLETFKKPYLKVHSEEVLLFLVDLADITSSTRLTREYIVYAIENGHLNLLKKLESYLQESDMRNLPGLNIYRSRNEAMIEYILELGITRTINTLELPSTFSLQFLQNLTQRELLLENGNPIEWNAETEKDLQRAKLYSILNYCQYVRSPDKESQSALIRLFYANISSPTYPIHFYFPESTSMYAMASEISAYFQAIKMRILLKELQSNGHNSSVADSEQKP